MGSKVRHLHLWMTGAGCCTLLGLAVLCSPTSLGQIEQRSNGLPQQHQPLAPEDPNPMAATNAARLEHLREDERRKRLLSDTEKLVQLSTELKADVEKTSKDELSVEVVRKAAELEKLAHDVKERMRGQ